MARSHSSQYTPSWIPRLRYDSLSFKRIAGVAFLAVLLGLISYASARALVKGNHTKDAAIKLERKLTDAKTAKAQLQARKDWLNSPEGVRAQGRQNGLAAPGEEEMRYVAPQPPATSLAATEKVEMSDAVAGLLLAGLLFFAVAFILGISLLLYRRYALRKKRPTGMLTPRSELRRRRRHAHEPAH